MLQRSDIRILLAEDDLTNAKLLTELLKLKYDNVVTVYDGVEGIEKFKTQEFDVVISDIEMPKANGLEMINEIKKLKPSIFTILQTAYTEAHYFIEAINLKVDRFLPKPINTKLMLFYLDEYEMRLQNLKTIKEQERLLVYYKQVIDDILVVVKTDTKGNITFVNQKFTDVSGYTKDEAIGKNHAQLVSHKLMDKNLFKPMWENITQLKPYKMIIRNKTKQGSSYWLKSYFYPIIDEQNNLIEIMAFSKNVTNQRKREKEKEDKITKEAHENISKAIEVSHNQFIKFIPLPTVIIDSNYLVTQYNDEFENIVLESTNTIIYEKLIENKLLLSDFIKNDENMFLLETLSRTDKINIDGLEANFTLITKNITQNDMLVSFMHV